MKNGRKCRERESKRPFTRKVTCWETREPRRLFHFHSGADVRQEARTHSAVSAASRPAANRAQRVSGVLAPPPFLHDRT